jgi:bacterioferritin-associated ferredoxin
MIICICRRLNETRLHDLAAQGLTCSKAVADALELPPKCGRCLEQMDAILSERAPRALMAAE